jgi:hypothetical protein
LYFSSRRTQSGFDLMSEYGAVSAEFADQGSRLQQMG